MNDLLNDLIISDNGYKLKNLLFTSIIGFLIYSVTKNNDYALIAYYLLNLGIYTLKMKK